MLLPHAAPRATKPIIAAFRADEGAVGRSQVAQADGAVPLHVDLGVGLREEGVVAEVDGAPRAADGDGRPGARTGRGDRHLRAGSPADMTSASAQKGKNVLIRRLLEGRKNYRMYHAKDGWEGLSQARQKLPDLIVTDLTMPGIDGFGLVEELKLDPRTKDIPVVVVSAKDITAEERKRLNGHIQALYQKGSLPTKKFVDQVINVIEESNESQQGGQG